MKTRFIVTVSGSRRFPLDMLRYDGAYPRRPQDVEAISAALEVGRLNVTDDLSVELNAERVTSDRWASFGWVVIAQRSYKE